MSKFIECKVCSKEIASSARFCPDCGAKNKKKSPKKLWFIAISILIVLGLVCIGSFNNEDKFFKKLDQYVEELNYKNDNIHNEYRVFDGDKGKLIAFIDDTTMSGMNVNVAMAFGSSQAKSELLDTMKDSSKITTNFVYEIADIYNYKVQAVGVINYINGVKVLETTDGEVTWTYGD